MYPAELTGTFRLPAAVESLVLRCRDDGAVTPMGFLSGAGRQPGSAEVGNKALLVIDMLNDFVVEGAPLEVPATREMVPHLREQIRRARENAVPVFFVCDAHDANDPEFTRMGWPPHALSGSTGAEVIDELHPSGKDTIIPKKSYSAFFETPLDTELKKRSITELLITGCVTNICVLYTVADAVQRGYKVTVIKNCVAGLTDDDHLFALRQMKDVLGADIIEEG